MSKDLRKWRWKLWLLSVVKIPLIRFVRPRILNLSEEGCEILIPLKTLPSYFGVDFSIIFSHVSWIWILSIIMTPVQLV